MVRNVRTNQDNTFETIIRSIQPFMKSYDIVSDKRVKLHISDTADTGQLEKALNNSGGKAERGLRGAVFVRFDDVMTNEDARKIVSLAFGEPPVETDRMPDDFNFSAMPGERDETQDEFGELPDSLGKDRG